MPSFCPKCGEYASGDACAKCGEKTVAREISPWKRDMLVKSASGPNGTAGIPSAFIAAARLGQSLGASKRNDGGSNSDREVARALYNFIPQDSATQIRLVKGDSVEVIRKDSDGWWYVQKGEERGLVPGSYVRIENPKSVIPDAAVLAAREASNQRFQELSSRTQMIRGSPDCDGVEYSSPLGLERSTSGTSGAPEHKQVDARANDQTERKIKVRKLRKCFACNETILGKTRTAKNQIFHEICLLCKGCREAIAEDEEYTIIKKKAYHTECAQEVFYCHKCDKEILGRVYRNAGHAYHKLCMICSECSQSVPEEAGEAIGDNLVCSDCVRKKEQAKAKQQQLENSKNSPQKHADDSQTKPVASDVKQDNGANKDLPSPESQDAKKGVENNAATLACTTTLHETPATMEGGVAPDSNDAELVASAAPNVTSEVGPMRDKSTSFEESGGSSVQDQSSVSVVDAKDSVGNDISVEVVPTPSQADTLSGEETVSPVPTTNDDFESDTPESRPRRMSHVLDNMNVGKRELPCPAPLDLSRKVSGPKPGSNGDHLCESTPIEGDNCDSEALADDTVDEDEEETDEVVSENHLQFQQERDSLRLSQVLDLETITSFHSSLDTRQTHGRLSAVSDLSDISDDNDLEKPKMTEQTEEEEELSDDEERELCGGCGYVLEGEAIGALEKFFHYECFKCSHCHRVIGEEEGYAEKDGMAFHQGCYQSRFSKKCSRCTQVLKGKVVKALNALYHPDCFVCFKCSASLSESFFEHEGEAICAGCKHEAVMAETAEAIAKLKPIGRGVAAYDFAAQDETQLTMHHGDEMQILQKDDDGWWLVDLRGERGYVPGSYLVEQAEQDATPAEETPLATPGLCSQCGTQNPDVARFCRSCGNRLQD